MRTTLEPTLGGGGQIGEQVDRQGGGLLSFCRKTLWKLIFRVFLEVNLKIAVRFGYKSDNQFYFVRSLRPNRINSQGL